MIKRLIIIFFILFLAGCAKQKAAEPQIIWGQAGNQIAIERAVKFMNTYDWVVKSLNQEVGR